jgi:hypothetical protein
VLKIKIVFVNVVFILLTACTSSSDTPEVAATDAPKGIYAGTITPTGSSADPAVALLTSDNKVAIVDTTTLETFIGTIASNSITGTMFASSAVSATSQVTSVVNNSIGGTYTSSLGGGTFSLVSNTTLYDRGALLSKLVGTWVDSVYTSVTGTTTWVIQADGSYTMTSTSACVGSGDFALIDAAKNEYSLTFVLSNCAGFNGTYSGIGSLSDTSNPDDTLTFMFNSASIGGLFSVIKP